MLGGRHLLSYGGNVRYNAFEITIAPEAENRTEMGVYVQEEVYAGPLRFAAGARLDKFGNLDDPVLSPRLMAMWKPTEEHSLRLSFNRAFRAPAVLNNYLDLTIRGVDLPLGLVCEMQPALCAGDPTLATRSAGLGPRSVGSEIAHRISPTVPPLDKESVTAYELAYTGTFGRGTTVGVALYINETEDNINFVGEPEGLAAVGLPITYSAAYPPPGWPLPPETVDHPLLRAMLFERLPATIAYLNLGPIRNRGIELSLDQVLSPGLKASVSYSWQDDPEPLEPEPGRPAYPIGEVSVAPHHRAGASLLWDRGRVFGSASAQYVGRTFWNDVLPQLGFDGYTDAYTLVGATVGVRWRVGEGRELSTALKGTNLLNREIRQHLFGDIQNIGVTAEARLSF